MKRNNQNKENIEIVKSICDYLPENKKAVIVPLISKLEFINSQLEKLQIEIEEKGLIEVYQNGNNQKGIKQSTNVKTYCSLLKSYTSICYKLDKMMPDADIIKGQNKLQNISDRLEDEL